MIDWLLAQGIKLFLSIVITWLQHKGYTDAATALGAKEAKQIVAEVKALKVIPEFPSQDTKGQATFTD